MHPTGPFSIPAIRNFVPEKLKPWVIILFVIVFQFSGGVYLAAVSEMVGSTALMQEAKIPFHVQSSLAHLLYSTDYLQSDQHVYP